MTFECITVKSPEDLEDPSEKCLFENQKGHHFSTSCWFHSPRSTFILGLDSALKVDWKYPLLRNHFFLFWYEEKFSLCVWIFNILNKVAKKMNHISIYLCGQKFKIEWIIFGRNQAVVSLSIETLKSGLFKLKGKQQNRKESTCNPERCTHSLVFSPPQQLLAREASSLVFCPGC